MNNGAGAGQRPEFEAQIGVIGHKPACGYGYIHGRKHSIRRAVRNSLRNTRYMQTARRLYGLNRHILRSIEAGGGTGAKIRKFMPLRPVMHKINSGRGLRIDLHMGCVHTFARPEIQKIPAKAVRPYRGEIAAFCPLPRGGNDGIGRIPAKAGQIIAPLSLVEFKHRFAKGNQFGHGRILLQV